MTPAVAEGFLRALGAAKIDKSTLPWLTANCVLAPWRHKSGLDKNPSLGILTGSTKPRIHCFSCHFSGSPEALLGELKLQSNGEFPIKDAIQFLEDHAEDSMLDLDPEPVDNNLRDPIPFPDSLWNSFSKIAANSWPNRYLNHRGVTDEDIRDYDFRWDGMEQRVCAPIRGRDHKLYGIRGRYIGPDRDVKPQRYWAYLFGGFANPQVWFGEDWVNVKQPVLVTEGIFGAIAARKFYRNTVSPLSATITAAHIKRMGDVDCWVHLFDGDKAGELASQNLRTMARQAAHIKLTLPSGQDPDSTVMRFGRQHLRGIIGQRLPVSA